MKEIQKLEELRSKLPSGSRERNMISQRIWRLRHPEGNSRQCRAYKSRRKKNRAQEIPGRTSRRRPVVQLTLDGKKIASYPSVSAAARAIAGDEKESYPRRAIRSVLSNMQGSAYGYRWIDECELMYVEIYGVGAKWA